MLSPWLTTCLSFSFYQHCVLHVGGRLVPMSVCSRSPSSTSRSVRRSRNLLGPLHFSLPDSPVSALLLTGLGVGRAVTASSFFMSKEGGSGGCRIAYRVSSWGLGCGDADRFCEASQGGQAPWVRRQGLHRLRGAVDTDTTHAPSHRLWGGEASVWREGRTCGRLEDCDGDEGGRGVGWGRLEVRAGGTHAAHGPTARGLRREGGRGATGQ